MPKTKTNKEQQMQYEEYGRDKAVEQITNCTYQEHKASIEQIKNHMKNPPSSLLDSLHDEESIKNLVKVYCFTLDNIPDSILYEVSYILDINNSDLEKVFPQIYSQVSTSLAELKLLEYAELYSNDFDRDIESLKKKVDYLSRLSDEPIRIKLPISLPRIKSNFYARCISELKIPSKTITALFKVVFENKVYKGDIELYQSNNEDKYQKFASFMDKQHSKGDSIYLDEKDLSNELEGILEPYRYYTGNPN